MITSRREFLITSAAASTSALWNRHGIAYDSADENRKNGSIRLFYNGAGGGGTGIGMAVASLVE